MSEAGTERVTGKVLRWLVPLLISALAIWLVLREIEISQFLTNLRLIRWPTFLLASVFYFVSYAARVFCWFILLRHKVSYRDVFFTMGVGYLLNNIFPFRLGEIGRAVFLDDPERISMFEVFSSIIVERVFDVFLAAMFVLSVLPRILGANYDQRLITIALALAVFGLAVLFLLAKYKVRIGMWLDRWGERSGFVRDWLTPKILHGLEGLSVLTTPRVFLLAFFSLAVSWGLAFVQNDIIFNSLYPDPPFWWMTFVLSAGAFGAALPSAPAGLGVFEGAVVAAFALLGVGAEVAFTHAIVIHAMTFIYASLIGLIGLRLRGEVLFAFIQRVLKRAPQVKAVE
ncbi:MAG: flippase-like domain-containing protein [Brevefilum sp.]|nr:flippase-like domain-containing protein [Brevefilum sp.]